VKPTKNKKIAIIGGGVAGLTAAYLLHEKYNITLFEKSDTVGGNAYTVTTPNGEEVDIAAAVFAKASYHNVFRLFRKLNIDTVGSFRMNPFAVSAPGVSFYNLDNKKGLFLTPGIKGLIAQHFEILKPDHVMSILRLKRGIKKAQTALVRGDLEGLTIEEALKRIPQLRGDAKLMFIGFLCLLSSMHCNDVLDAPAGFFIEKLKTYNDVIPPKALFSVCFVKNGTKKFVRALSAPYRDGIQLNAKIKTIKRRDADVLALMEDGRELFFDKVVFACNADQALELLQEPTYEEQRLLGAWKYTEGKIVVHRDHSSFPERALMEGFTFLYQEKGRYLETSVSGSLWSLSGVSKKSDLISTQHPNFPIRKDRIVFEKVFRTPKFDFKSCSTIRELPSLNGVKNTYYCGSHFGFGLQEDAVSSAIEVARTLNVYF
jgi:predicted NAD/FAD-binding protein